MKFRYKFITCLCAVAALACSCSDDDENAESGVTTTTTVTAGHEISVSVTVPSPVLATDAGNSAVSLSWAEGDELLLSYYNNVYQSNVLTMNGTGGAMQATFASDNVLTESNTSVHVHYPNTTLAATICKHNISKQTGTLEGLHAVDCMSGKGTVSGNSLNAELTRDVAIIQLCDMEFDPESEATAISEMTLTGDHVGVIRQWSSVTGDFVAAESGTITVTNEVPLSGNTLSNLYFAVFPEVTEAGDSYNLKVTLNDGAIYNIKWTMDAALEANKVYQVVPEVKNTYNLYPYKKAYKIAIPSLEDFEKSKIYTAYDGDLKVAEICLEFLYADPYKTRVIVVYPVGVLDYGAADYTKGFVAKLIDYSESTFTMSENTLNSAGGTLSFDYSTFKAEYTPAEKSPINTVYLNKFGVTDETLSGATKLTPKPYILTDPSGNEYSVFKLGIDVWMQSNLRTTKLADGTDIEFGWDTTPKKNNNYTYAFYHNFDESHYEKYGLLYGRGLLDDLAVTDPDERNTWGITTCARSRNEGLYNTTWAHMMVYTKSINFILAPYITTWNGVSGHNDLAGMDIVPSGYINWSGGKYKHTYANIVTYFWIKDINTGNWGRIQFCNSWGCNDFAATSFSTTTTAHVAVRMVRQDKHGE